VASIIDGLFSGRSGIQSHGTAIAVLADNISNQNTVGFKAGRADFVDLLAGSLGGGSGSISTGSGSAVKSVTRVLTQGTFEFTGRGLDLGIDGNGFLLVRDRVGVTYYTRAGNLSVDPDGKLLDQNGFEVLGYAANGSGAITPLNVSERVAGDIATNGITLGGNLNATSDVSVPPLPIDTPTYTDLNNAEAFSANVDVFDSLGGKHGVRVSFYKTNAADRLWEAKLYVDGADVNDPGATPGMPFEIGTINMQFGPNGLLVNPAAAIGQTGLINWSNGSAAAALEVDLSRFTQFASSSNIDTLGQNGTGSGSVVGYNVTRNGDLVAQLDNGQTALIGTIALANFANNEGLRRVGGSLYAASSDSGEPIIGVPGVGTFGIIESGALELSTADMAADFIKLISLQRGFQGSSRIISSISDLLNEVVNLAR
jgi:flagellar hook protein FlgE